MHGAFPPEDMATCRQCGHAFIVIEPQMRDEIEHATVKYCLSWHDLSQL